MTESASNNPQSSSPVADVTPVDTPPASAAASKEVETLATELANAKKEAADNYDKYLRLAADMENLRRRTVREKDEIRQFAASRVLEDLLPVLDNFGFGLAAAKDPKADLKNLIAGIQMVQDQLRNSLTNHGLKEVNPLAQDFDPNLHESVSAQPSDTVPNGKVCQVIRVGYTLNNRLLRPATVVISSGPAAKPDAVI